LGLILKHINARGHVGETDKILPVAARYIVVGPPETKVTHIRIRNQRLSRRRHAAASEGLILEAEIH